MQVTDLNIEKADETSAPTLHICTFWIHNNSVIHGSISEIQEDKFLIQTKNKPWSYLAYFKHKYCVFRCDHF
jgi:hypothetical protein